MIALLYVTAGAASQPERIKVLDAGSTTELNARQRPQIVFDRAGTPQFLYNGVTSVEDGVSRSWTMAVPFK